MLEKAIDVCVKDRGVKKMYLHVQSSNESALAFYKKHGFTVKEELRDYYTDIDPPHCFVLERIVE